MLTVQKLNKHGGQSEAPKQYVDKVSFRTATPGEYKKLKL